MNGPLHVFLTHLQFDLMACYYYSAVSILWDWRHILFCCNFTQGIPRSRMADNRVSGVHIYSFMQNSELIRKKQEAFEREAIPHMNALYNFALRMTGNSDDAQDLVQETYLKAFRFFDKFEQGTNCKAWLFRILKNSYINLYRKEAKEPEKVDFDEIQDFYPSQSGIPSGSEDLQEKIYDKLLDDEVLNALQSLPEEFRTAGDFVRH